MVSARGAARVLVIGAGPAGLTAALELIERGGVLPLVVEKTDAIGGISMTARYRGNRIDIGGHRFFSRSEAVMAWWARLFPLEGTPYGGDAGAPATVKRALACFAAGMPPAGGGGVHAPERDERVMLIRARRSRILFDGRLLEYPLRLDRRTLRDLRLGRLLRMGGSYARARLFPYRREASLEQFLINRFGRDLYRTFFRDYTEKVWGVPCAQIRPEWGAQRIKGLSVGAAVRHAAARAFMPRRARAAGAVETSLIERFLYPKYGPGQLWEHVAARVTAAGGVVVRDAAVVGLAGGGGRVTDALIEDTRTGSVRSVPVDAVFSSMPVAELIPALARGGHAVPPVVEEVARGLVYRGFVTVGLLLKRFNPQGAGGTVPDHWIYVQEPRVKLGRIQVFNNWSPWLVADPATVWLGLEYFCDQGDAFWRLPDADLVRRAVAELAAIGFADPADVLDAAVIRMPKAYPCYFGSYDRFPLVREYTDRIENLFLIGRNGMHRYNNQDHSMLAAMAAVDAFTGGEPGKDRLWEVNAGGEYIEAR